MPCIAADEVAQQSVDAELQEATMAQIPFTDRELKRAWRDLSQASLPASGGERKNPHRLLMFYAVECGLKAVWLKRQCRSLFEQEDIDRTKHNLRQVLKDLGAGWILADHSESVQLQPLLSGNVERKGDISILHQAWRYGGTCKTPSDAELEKQLEQVLDWIRGELK